MSVWDPLLECLRCARATASLLQRQMQAVQPSPTTGQEESRRRRKRRKESPTTSQGANALDPHKRGTA